MEQQERRLVTVGSVSVEAAAVQVGPFQHCWIYPPQASEKIRRAWARRRDRFFYPLGLRPRKRKPKEKDNDE